jgi:hypothetical protein
MISSLRKYLLFISVILNILKDEEESEKKEEWKKMKGNKGNRYFSRIITYILLHLGIVQNLNAPGYLGVHSVQES